MPNNKMNVSTTRGVQGGYFFSAPTTTTDVPTLANFATWAPGEDWECLGYIPEDGFTESLSQDGNTELRDINLDIVDSAAGSFTETLEVGLMEIGANALAAQYGHENVTEAAGGITVEHNWGNSEEERSYAMLLLLKGTRRWVKYIPRAKRTELGDFTGNKTTAASRTITLTYLNNNAGTGCIDFIQPAATN